MTQAAAWAGATLLAATLLVSCDQEQQTLPTAQVDEPKPTAATGKPGRIPPGPVAKPGKHDRPAAVVQLQAAQGHDLEAEVQFESVTDGVRMVVTVQGLEPGKHGLHIHEKGDCSDISGGSMGAHFAPENHLHKLPSEGSERHLGDLGNIEVDASGAGHLTVTVRGATLEPNRAMSLLGRAVVIHSGVDAGQARQPAGSSGTPLACGVVRRT